MSRFATYLRSQQLGKAHLVTAEERLKRGDKDGAITALIASVREFQTATNNLASIQFQPRKRVLPRRKPSLIGG